MRTKRMNVLWVTNIALPEYSQITGTRTNPFGGWLVNLSNQLRELEYINLSIAFPTDTLTKNKKVIYGDRINYYTFNNINSNSKDIKNFNSEILWIINEVKPDLVHLHGSELRHTYEIIKVCKKLDIKTVVSIQGLVSKIATHMKSGLPNKVYHGKTIRDIIKKGNTFQLEKEFIKRGENEIKALKLGGRVIGRTLWDRAAVWSIDRNIQYFYCNETLRQFFYDNKWNINKINRYSIFISQANYSIKGFHFMVEAASILVKKYPELKIKVAGNNIIDTSSFKKRMSITSYGKYIKSLIQKYKLENNIIFLGILNEKEIGKEYLNAHVFVMPSTIENSPNSLGEAMLLGIPSVASYVGGIPDMTTHGKDSYLYQHDAPYMLAYYLDKIFMDDSLSIKISKEARKKAMKTHNIEQNLNTLLKIYNQILDNNSLELNEISRI